MWLIPSQLSDFAQESAGSTKPSAQDFDTSDCNIELRPTVNGKPTPKPFSWPGWKNRPWSQRLFGAAILGASTDGRFVERWTESLRASRASRGATPGSVRGQKTPAGCGRLSFGSSLTWDRGSCSWKTSQLSLLAEVSNTCSVTLPKWGSMRSGAVSRRKPLELRTGEIACSSWPTARAREDGDYAYSQGDHDKVVIQLGGAVKAWATSTAPAPHDNDDTAGRGLQNQKNIASMAIHWPTPNVPSRGPELSKEHCPGSGGIDLKSTVMQWGTPRANQHKGGGENTPVNGFLDRQAEVFSPPDPAPTGAESPKPSGRRGFRVLVDGSALVLDESRADQLRCGGNGVVALQGAVAFVELVRRAMN